MPLFPGSSHLRCVRRPLRDHDAVFSAATGKRQHLEGPSSLFNMFFTEVGKPLLEDISNKEKQWVELELPVFVGDNDNSVVLLSGSP
eukprot:3139462-Lingulodinium_polyedra.AAC.1